MKYTEIHGDLFSYACHKGDKKFCGVNRIPVHCISADFAMGAGIAVPMASRYDLRNRLEVYDGIKAPWCLFVHNVMNLITKDKVYQKPTYESLRESLVHCKDLCRANDIKWLVMPKIGCGIDGLDWERVSVIIQETFYDTDVDILVCIL